MILDSMTKIFFFVFAVFITAIISYGAGNVVTPAKTAATANTTAAPTGGKSPKDFPGLSFWLDAGSLKSKDHDKILSWADQSGTGLVLTAVNQTAPTFVANASNGKPAVRFTGKNTFMESAVLGTKVLKENEATLFMVLKTAADAVVTDAFAWGDCANNRFNVHAPAYGSFVFQMGSPPKDANMDAQVPPGYSNAYHVMTFFRQGSQARIESDGNVMKEVNTFKANLTINKEAGFTIGALCRNGYQGDIAEIVLYKAALSKEQIAEVGRGLASKYGLKYQ